MRMSKFLFMLQSYKLENSEQVRICIVVSIFFCFLVFTKVHFFKLGRNEKIVNYANQGVSLIYNGKEKNKSDQCLVISDQRHSVYYFLDADDTDNADLKGCAIKVDKKKIRVIRVIRV